MEFGFSAPGIGSVCLPSGKEIQHVNATSVNFPGAVNAKFTTSLKFSNPAEETAMPVYRVMDADGKIVDKNRAPPDISGEELVKLYKDMLTSSCFCPYIDTNN